MLIKTFSSSVQGVGATLITIEVNITQGIRFFIVGLADHAIRESQQRIESALTCNGFTWPRYRVVINLAPADIRKEGTHFDLPLAVAILAASGQLHPPKLKEYLMLGELSLDGGVMAVKGVLPMVLNARENGFKGVIVPSGNAEEASVVERINVLAVKNLKEVVMFFQGDRELAPVKTDIYKAITLSRDSPPGDFSEVRGQEGVKRALLVAAAGNHNILIIYTE